MEEKKTGNTASKKTTSRKSPTKKPLKKVEEINLDVITNEKVEDENEVLKKEEAKKEAFLYALKKKETINTVNPKKEETFLDVKFGDDYLLKIITTEMRTKRMVVLPDDLPRYGFEKDSFLISKAIAMSCSIPLVFSQYKLGNYIFVDGGVTNNFPIEEVANSKIPVFAFKLKRKYFNKIFINNSIWINC